MRASLVSIFILTALVVGAACSKADPVEEHGTRRATRDGGGSDDGNVPLTTSPTPIGTGSDGSTTPPQDAGNPTFDITKVASISGTFVTDMTANDGVSTSSTVTWSFTIDGIGDATQPTTTAKWSAQATTVTGGGTTADFPPDTNIALSLQQQSGTGDPRTGAWEFYGNELTPYVFILVKYEAGQIVDFYYYRRIVEDEGTPADKPRNLTFTTTNK